MLAIQIGLGMATIKRCNAPFAFSVDGHPRVVVAGEVVSTDDPAYTKERAHMFDDVEVHVAESTKRRDAAEGKVSARVADAAPVEQATAAPGEKRTVVRPAVKQASAPPTKKD